VETITFHGVPHRLATSLDITERKQAEAAIRSLLQISEKLNATLDIDALLDSLIIEAMKLIDAELGWSGLRTEEGMVLHTHISRDLQVVSFPYLWPPEVGLPGWVLAHKVPYVMNDAQSDKLIIPEIRERFDVKAAIDTPILDAEGEVIGFFEVNNKKNGVKFSDSDVEQLVAMSRIASIALQNAMLLKAANEQHEQLRALSTKLVEVQEAERRALTTELHDRVGQNLTGFSINLQNMKALLSDEMAQTLAAKFDDAQALVEHTTRQIRDIMAELHPPELEDYGPAAALETYAERVASRGNLELIADLPDLAPPPLPSDVRIALFRAAQEAITNVLKHADATRMEVSLKESDGGIRLRVEDDGKGFEPDAATQNEAQAWGLKIMRERIESIGGKVQIESEPGEGTRVVFEIERPS
jgi:signal transduction histidine kinase